MNSLRSDLRVKSASLSPKDPLLDLLLMAPSFLLFEKIILSVG